MAGQDFRRPDGSTVEDGFLRLPLWRFLGRDFRHQEGAAHELTVSYHRLVTALVIAERGLLSRPSPSVNPTFTWIPPASSSDEEMSSGSMSSASPADDVHNDPDWAPGMP